MNKISIQYDESRFSEKERQAIAEALEYAAAAHAGQLRASGEPYLIHPVAVAEIVAGWGLDHEAVMAALLHDVVEDTGTQLKDVEARFGPKVAQLVDGVTKLRLSSGPRPAADSPRLAASNENLRKLLLATAQDVRVIMIKLADRLHNMRTLQYLDSEHRKRIARESLDIYAPLADRLGMGQLKVELEDIGFSFYLPEEFEELSKLVHIRTKQAERYLDKVKRSVAKYLAAAGVTVLKIEGRPKHMYSIYRKLAKVDGDIDKIYDLIAVRVIVPDVAACYQALGVLHQHWRPLIYRIKDYIAVPKTNGYQSLHTTVFAEEGHITEIQIRTPEMHSSAEYGLAAHFYYAQQKAKDPGGARAGTVVPESMQWVNQLRDLQQQTAGGQEFVEGARLELFASRIFVFSPKGDLYDMPEDATPLDFAFMVHTDIGLRALGARVNGKMVPLDSRLENRDVVEIVTRREAAPSRDWLGFVATAQAKGKIRAWFRADSRSANVASGQATIEAELKAWGLKKLEDLPKGSMANALDVLHMKSVDDLLAAVGEGSLSTVAAIRRLIPDAAKPKGTKVVRRREPTGAVVVAGQKLPYQLAPCCRPVYPQPIVGYVTRGKGVTVHAKGCRNLPADRDRYASCRWEVGADSAELVLVDVELVALNRSGMLSDVTGTVARRGLDIHGLVSEHRRDDVQEINIGFGVEVPDLFALARLMHDLEKLPGVTAVRRTG